MKIRILSIFLILVFILPAAGKPVLASPLSNLTSPGISPAGLLNPNGTLNLDGHFSGSLDLRGYHVSLDPQRGPVFDLSSPKGLSSQEGVPSPEGQAAPAVVSGGQWASLGGGLQALNDWVLAVTVSGSNVYIGGRFTNANGIPAADYIVMWNGTKWMALGSNGAGGGAVSGPVQAIAVSGSKVYVGGFFGGVTNKGTAVPGTKNIAQWDGANWSALSGVTGGGPLNANVLAIAISGADVYIGGTFTDANGNLAADYITKWNSVTGVWSALGNDGVAGGSLTSYVDTIVVSGTYVYVGGNFTDVHNGSTVLPAADYIAKWDGVSWSALGSASTGQGVLNNVVCALAFDAHGNLYVGGAFTAVVSGSFAIPGAAYIARWDGAWHSLGFGETSSSPSLQDTVRAIAVSGTHVYVGGWFYDVNNYGTVLSRADHIAQWDGANWSALGSGDGLSGAVDHFVYAIGIRGTTLFVGGDFPNLNNKGTLLSARYLATFDGVNWSSPPAAAPVGGLSSFVRAVAVSGTNVYVGGDFYDLYDGMTRNTAADYIAKWDGTKWSALGDNGLGEGALDGSVYSLAVSGSTVYAGGSFYSVYNHGTHLGNASYIAKWDGTNWSGLGDDGSGSPSLNSYVYAIAVIGSNVYAGGDFTDVNNKGTVWPSADYIARWDGNNWYPLLGNGAGDGSLNSTVNALAVSGTNLYVGGDFTDVNDGGNVLGDADYLAKWNGTHWLAVGFGSSATVGALNASVDALAVSGTALYVGGEFTNVNNQGSVLSAADYIAKWDGSNWSALGHDPSGDGVIHPGSYSSEIDAIVVSGSNVYVGGYFKDIYNNTTFVPAADFIARWDGSRWSALGSNAAGDGSLGESVLALALNGLTLYVGGAFTQVNNGGTVLKAADYIAAYGTGTRKVFIPILKR